jgi:NTE family protein
VTAPSGQQAQGELIDAQRADREVAFVLGGGGVFGAYEVGMLRALFEVGIRPDLVVGTSIGAVNGALVAADPGPGMIDRLAEVWTSIGAEGVFSGSVLGRISTLVRSRTALHGNEGLRRLLDEHLPIALIEDLPVRFQCVGAAGGGAAGGWFSHGPITSAVLASCAVPGLLPPVEIDGVHYVDGGLVNSIPVGRAVALGARTIYVLQVGRVEQPLTPPSNPLEVALVAFEIARRHRFMEEMADLPEHVTVHVLPSGTPASDGADLSQLRYRDLAKVADRIEQAYEATAAYLDER